MINIPLIGARTHPRKFLRRTLRCSWMVLLLAAGSCVNTAIADTTYWRVTLDRITVVANDSSNRCVRLAAQLVTFERLLADLAGWSSDFQPPPIALYSLSQQDARRVLLSDAERRRQSSANMQIYSKFLPGSEFNIAAIVDAGGSDDPLQSVLLLYAESALISGPTQRDPPWFQFGVANLLNGVVIRADGSVLLNRNVPFEPVGNSKGSALQRQDLMQLLQIRATDLNGNIDLKEYFKFARAWAQFGLLTGEQRREHYRELALLLLQGTPATEAVKDAFGIPYEEVAEQFRGSAWRNDVQFHLPPLGAPVAIPAPTKLEPGQVNTLLGVVAQRAAVAAPERM
jgi:hypothetical protein